MRTKEIALLILLFLVCLDVCLVYNLADLDVWARMAVGKKCVELGEVSTREIFAYTSVKPLFVDHEWGSGVLFFLAADALGQKGLLLLRVFLYFGTLFFLHLCVRERIEKPDSLLLHLLLAYSIFLGFLVTVRSHVFTYFLFALWFYLLERSRKGKNRGLVLLPITMILWANVHGGFVSGLGLILFYGAGEFLNRGNWKKYFILFPVCLLVTLINPYGVDYWIYLAKALTMARPNIPEWRPFVFFSGNWISLGFEFLFFLSAFLFLLDRVRRIRIDWVDFFLLFGTGFLAVRHLRHATFFSMACFPFVYSSLRKLWEQDLKEKLLPHRVRRSIRETRWGNITLGAFHGLLFMVCILLACSLPFRVHVHPSAFPVRAVEFIQENRLEGNLLTQFAWGSFAIWELFPRCRVSIDGRYEEVYPHSTYEDVYRFANGREGWDAVLEKYDNDLILIRRDSPVYLKMKVKKDEWEIVYEDDLSALYLPTERMQRDWVLPGKGGEGVPKDHFSTRGRLPYVSGVSP